MGFESIATVWADLDPDAKIIIATEFNRWKLAEKIKVDNLPFVSDIKLVDIEKDEYETQIKALSEKDLLITLLTVEGFMGKNHRDRFPPFTKPVGVKAKYIFIRLDVPEESLLSGLNTDIKKVDRIVADMSILRNNAKVRVTTDKGTDFTTHVKSQEVLPYHARDLGGNAFLPPSEVSEYLFPDATNGVVAADVTVGEFRVNGKILDELGMVDKPVTVKIENGFVKEVIGGTIAERLKKCFASLPTSHHFVVELGHGLSDMEPTGIIGVDESIAGTCHVGIGNRNPYHLDLVIKNPKITVL